MPSVLDPPDRAEYEAFCKAVSDSIREISWEPLITRCLIAARAWRILHPDSQLGDPTP